MFITIKSNVNMEGIFKTKDIEVFKKIIHQILDNITSKNNKLEWDMFSSVDAMQQSKHEITELLLANNFNASNIKNVLLLNPNLFSNESMIDIMCSIIDKNMKDLIFGIVLEHNSKAGPPVLVDFNWTVKFIFGTSQLRSLHYPVLQLVLKSRESNNVYNDILYDMKKDTLAKIISLLQNV